MCIYIHTLVWETYHIFLISKKKGKSTVNHVLRRFSWNVVHRKSIQSAHFWKVQFHESLRPSPIESVNILSTEWCKQPKVVQDVSTSELTIFFITLSHDSFLVLKKIRKKHINEKHRTTICTQRNKSKQFYALCLVDWSMKRYWSGSGEPRCHHQRAREHAPWTMQGTTQRTTVEDLGPFPVFFGNYIWIYTYI